MSEKIRNHKTVRLTKRFDNRKLRRTKLQCWRTVQDIEITESGNNNSTAEGIGERLGFRRVSRLLCGPRACRTASARRHCATRAQGYHARNFACTSTFPCQGRPGGSSVPEKWLHGGMTDDSYCFKNAQHFKILSPLMYGFGYVLNKIWS